MHIDPHDVKACWRQDFTHTRRHVTELRDERLVLIIEVRATREIQVGRRGMYPNTAADSGGRLGCLANKNFSAEPPGGVYVPRSAVVQQYNQASHTERQA